MSAGTDSRERPPRGDGVPTTTGSGLAALGSAQEVPRWCARLGFSRDFWTGRARVVCDPEVEASVRDTRRLPGAAAELLAELVPERANTVWLLAQRPDDLAGPRRRGVHALEEFDSLLAQAPWEVAIIELGQFFVDAASLSRFAARARGRLENRLDTRAFRLLSAAAEGALGGRTVIVSVPAHSRGGLTLSDFQELLEQHFPRARVYALAPVPVAVVVDCGEVVREDEDEGDAGDEDDDSPPPLGFDNRLGEDLRYDTYLALVNAPAEPEGVTLVELPAAALTTATGAPRPAEPRPSSGPHDAARPQDTNRQQEARSSRQEAELENLKIQLGQARRQVELAAIARQSLVEQLDAAQARVDNLEDQIAEQQRRQSDSEVGERAPRPAGGALSGGGILGGGSSGGGTSGALPAAAPTPAPALDTRPDATQATLLALRWELEQARDELRRALGRPVEALEREVAELRARLGVSTPAD